jgi:hypothetical protein
MLRSVTMNPVSKAIALTPTGVNYVIDLLGTRGGIFIASFL